MKWSSYRKSAVQLLSPDVVLDIKHNLPSFQTKGKELLDLLKFEAEEEEKEYQVLKIVVYRNI